MIGPICGFESYIFCVLRVAVILQDQERDLIRAFQARLAEVNKDLEDEKRKNREGILTHFRVLFL